jgi:hypothetical protein
MLGSKCIAAVITERAMSSCNEKFEGEIEESQAPFIYFPKA